MPWMNAAADLVHVDVLAGDWTAARARWDTLYPEVLETPAWERWLLGSKLAIFRAEMALQEQDAETAAEWADVALAATRAASRVKYQLLAHDVLGRAQAALGRADQARRELAAATTLAEKGQNPHARLLTHVHAAGALYGIGDDEAAAAHHTTATKVAQEVASGLTPERAAAYRAAVPLPTENDYR
jgi:ATP/maltotriose-dependent transcriptional regulator MalT